MATDSGHRAVLLGLFAMLSLAGCGGNGPTGPGSSDDWPVTASGTGSTCGNASAIYFVSGLSSRVVNPSAAPPLEARVRVGETIKLQVNYQGCGFTVDEVWNTTNPTAGVVEPIRFGDPPGFSQAVLHVLAPGELSVWVEFRAPDGRRHQTTTGYCDLDAQYPGLPGLGVCGNPKKIGLVRVVP